MKRIAFVKEDNKVALVLNCEEKLFNAIVAGYSFVDATEADPALTFNWAHVDGQFTAPDKVE